MKRLIFIVALATFLLAGCGTPKVGDKFILKESVTGGHSINSFDKVAKEIQDYEKQGIEFDSPEMTQLVDMSDIEVFDKGDEVEITDVSDKYNMYKVKHIDPDTGDKKEVWVDKDLLEKSR
jgi:hypothetical protein